MKEEKNEIEYSIENRDLKSIIKNHEQRKVQEKKDIKNKTK